MKVICFSCGKEFNKIPSEIKKSKHNYCSHSCAAKSTNKLRTSNPKTICSCGNRKDRKAKFCQKCKNLNEFERVQNSEISKYILKGNARIKYSPIRKWAKIASNFYNLSKECSICSFSIHTEVCHIKPISSFSENQLMKEVNSKENLIRLCPNHHYMLDKGLISPAEVRTRKSSD